MESAGEEGVGVREGEEGVQRCINQFFVLDCKIAKEEKCTTIRMETTHLPILFRR